MTANESAQKDSWAQYTRVGRELTNRTFGPLHHPTFVIYFLLVMLLVGPFSIWVEVFTFFFLGSPAPAAAAADPATPTASASLAGLRTALLTFFPAVTATTALQLVWAERWKQMRAVAMLFFVIIAILAACMTPRQIGDSSAVAMGLAATVVALWLWWIANANNPDLLGEIDPSDPIGGDTATGPLKGDLKKFIV